jgi:hypothetical protein
VSRRQPRASVALTPTLVNLAIPFLCEAADRNISGSILPHDAGAILIRGRPQLPVAGLDSITLEWLRSGSRSHEGGSSREIWPVL